METNEKTKKNGIFKAIIILISIVSIIAIAGFAYARYITRINGNAQAPVAKWSFDSKILNSAQTVEVSDFSVTRTDNNGDVNSETIAPGTSGEFIIEIDATGTETLLTYETKMTLTNKPKNLKFYWDSSKTQEIIVENEMYLALNGFMSLEDNKKRDIPIYWDWPLETGSSPSEIEENDEIDTTFIGKTMSMQIATTGKQVMSNPYASGVASTTVNGKITVYDSVQDAIDAAENNQGAVVTLLTSTITETIEIGAGQNIILNTNGKELTSTGTTITNSGELKITGNGAVTGTSASSAIKNNEEGILNINGVTIGASQYAIENYGVSTDDEKPAVKIVKGTIKSIRNYCIDNFGTGTIEIVSGNLQGVCGIRNRIKGIILIHEGNINTTNGHGIRNYTGDIIMYGGNIKTGSYGDGIWMSDNGTILVTGGIIVGATNGIVSTGTGGNITVGINDTKVSTTTPIIMATNGHGVAGTCTKYFYDGIIKVPLDKTLINEANLTVPTGYHLAQGDNETIDDVEYKVMYLVKD